MDALWEYLLVFLAAATPWLEALIVIPVGIIRGLNPIIVSIVAFVGNLLTILLVVFFYEKIVGWITKKRNKSGDERKLARARRIWDKYGLPGLSLTGPLLVGTHFTILMALALGSSKKASTWWMTISLVLWCIICATGTHYGFNLFKLLRH